MIQPQTASEAAAAIREKLINRAPEGTLNLMKEFIEHLVNAEKLKRFDEADDRAKGHVQGMASIEKEIASILIAIEQKRKEHQHG